VRVTAAFNRMLGIPGAVVVSVVFAPEGVVVGLRRRFRRLTCPCGWSTKATYDRSVRRWRHLDLGACRLLLETEIRRVDCRACKRVRTEAVPWARPGARHTRDFEDVAGFLAQRVDKTTVATLLRVSWETVAGIVVRVVAEALDPARRACQVVCVRWLVHVVGAIRPGKATANALSAWFHPQVPVPRSPPLWCPMFLIPR